MASNETHLLPRQPITAASRHPAAPRERHSPSRSRRSGSISYRNAISGGPVMDFNHTNKPDLIRQTRNGIITEFQLITLMRFAELAVSGGDRRGASSSVAGAGAVGPPPRRRRCGEARPRSYTEQLGDPIMLTPDEPTTTTSW